MKSSDLVILIHGFCRTAKDMQPLQRHLSEYYTTVEAVTLPTTFQPLERCVELFAAKFTELATVWNAANGGTGRIHMVGHSMGGLIIRQFLATRQVRQLGRCVMIGTPNGGSRLADLAKLLFPPALAIFQPLKCLITERPEIALPRNAAPPEVGIIAGSCSNLWLGYFLAKPNDGRVEVAATKLAVMQDFLVLDWHRLEIHHRAEVAAQVHQFLQQGSFQRSS